MLSQSKQYSLHYKRQELHNTQLNPGLIIKFSKFNYSPIGENHNSVKQFS